MTRLQQLCKLLTFWVLLCQSLAFAPRASHTKRGSNLDRRLIALQGSGRDDGSEPKDYTGVASSLFGNLRIPASLFAGAAAGAAFAMPLGSGEGIKIGFVKRIYALLMMASMGTQIIAIVVSTLAMGSLATINKKTSSLVELMDQHYEFEWVTARLCFLTGLILFSCGAGLRAWVAIACSVTAKAGLGIISSATLMALAFVDAEERSQQFSKSNHGLIVLPVRFVKLLSKRLRKMEPFFLATVITALLTTYYMGSNIGHIWRYLATN